MRDILGRNCLGKLSSYRIRRDILHHRVCLQIVGGWFPEYPVASQGMGSLLQEDAPRTTTCSSSERPPWCPEPGMTEVHTWTYPDAVEAKGTVCHERVGRSLRLKGSIIPIRGA